MYDKKQTFIDDGVLILKDLYTKEELTLIASETKKFIESRKPYDVKADINANFNLLRKRKDTVINKRIASRDGDQDMVDVWNYDVSLSDECKNILYNKAKQINDFISTAFSCNYDIKTYNLYLNKGISTTRGLHADSHFFPSRIKSFLFLSDVIDRSFGPFSYIKGTHLGEGLKYHRKYDIYEPLNEDEKQRYTIFDNISIGDTVIACVSGAHRGLPQEKNKERIALVTSYDPR